MQALGESSVRTVWAILVVSSVLAACSGRAPAPVANDSPAPDNVPGNTAEPAEPVKPSDPGEATPSSPPASVEATRHLGRHRLAAAVLSANLVLPWQEGDSPEFRFKLEPPGKLHMQGWIEDRQGEQISMPARLLLSADGYVLHPVTSGLGPGDYFVVVSTETALGTQTARFPLQLR